MLLLPPMQSLTTSFMNIIIFQHEDAKRSGSAWLVSIDQLADLPFIAYLSTGSARYQGSTLMFLGFQSQIYLRIRFPAQNEIQVPWRYCHLARGPVELLRAWLPLLAAPSLGASLLTLQWQPNFTLTMLETAQAWQGMASERKEAALSTRRQGARLVARSTLGDALVQYSDIRGV